MQRSLHHIRIPYRYVDPAQVPAIIDHAASKSRESGVFYLGMGAWVSCAIDRVDCYNGSSDGLIWERAGILYSRCTGLLAHAMGIFKWRAQWLWDEIQDRMWSLLGNGVPDNAVQISGDVTLYHSLAHMLPRAR